MKQLVGVDIGRYVFNAEAKTISFVGCGDLSLDNILLITNVTDHIILYNFADASLGGTMSNNVLTLAYDTSSMDSNDNLNIYVDIPSAREKHIEEYLCCIKNRLDGETTVVGNQNVPFTQHQKEGSNYDQVNELLTYDTNLERVFGSQKITNNKNRLEVDIAQASDTVVNGAMRAVNDEVSINLDGHQTVSVQFSGTWAGTQSFYATVDGLVWSVIYGSNIAVLTAQVASTTASTTVFVFSVAGMKAFKVQTTAYTSGTCRATIRAARSLTNFKSQLVTGTATVSGSVGTLTQRTTSSELLTFNNPSAQLAHTLTSITPWNPNHTLYASGDWVVYNGQAYMCIAAPGSTVANILPTNTTYWARDLRGDRSVLTKDYASRPDAQRLRVEVDLDYYQKRLMEDSTVTSKISAMCTLAIAEKQLLAMQSQGGGNSYNIALGGDAMSHYCMDEVR